MEALVPSHPYLKPWYRLVRDDRQIHFQYGERIVSLQGRAAITLLPALLPLLDGARSVEAIHQALGEAVRPATERALATLARSGLLAEGPALAEDEPIAFSSTVRLHAAFPGAPSESEIAAKLRCSCVGMLGSGPASEDIARQLGLAGIHAIERVADFDASTAGFPLVIVTPSAAELSELGRWNRRALQTKTPWLLVSPYDGQLATVGPLMLPDETCCYECFRRRRAANYENAETQHKAAELPATFPNAPALNAVIAGITSLLVVRWLTLADHFLPGSYYAVVPGVPVSTSTHKVYRVPRCQACSKAAHSAPPSPWHEKSAPECG